MPASGSSIFTDADGYQAGLRDIFDLLVLHPLEFRARLTWVELPSLNLLRAREDSSRVTYVTLPQERAFVFFPLQPDSFLICSGVELKFGDIMFHGLGEHLHQRTTTATSWGSISLTAASLLNFGQTIAGQDLVAPREGQVLRPRPADRQRLLRLHTQAGRIAETRLGRLENKAVVHALEQDLIWVLVTCLAGGVEQKDRATARALSDLLVKFEALLAERPFRWLRTNEICSSLGVTERTLRASCSAALGMSPRQYQRLRRLAKVRTELLLVKPVTVDATEVIARYGFASLHHFVAEYWDAYGEMPPIAPRSPITP
jgi:AraC-like DNA-binding protein